MARSDPLRAAGEPAIRAWVYPGHCIGSVLDENGDIQFGVEETSATGNDGAVETSVTVSFVPPAVSLTAGPRIPLLSLAARVEAGGTLSGGQTLYYAISGCDGEGNEGDLSFIVAAAIVNDDSAVRLTNLSFSPETASFHAYRGNTPAQLFRIASNQPLAAEFVDSGLNKQLIPPADPNFDHANFYWQTRTATRDRRDGPRTQHRRKHQSSNDRESISRNDRHGSHAVVDSVRSGPSRPTAARRSRYRPNGASSQTRAATSSSPRTAGGSAPSRRTAPCYSTSRTGPVRQFT